MYNEYEESFYYEKPSSAGTDAAGEALGLGIGMGIGAVSIILTAILFLITRFDILSSSLMALLFYILTYKNEWNNWVYIIGVILIIAASMLLQHIFKLFRFLYGLFTCVVVSVIGTVFIGYDCEKRMYTIMAVCFGVTALLGFISWKCHIEK